MGKETKAAISAQDFEALTYPHLTLLKRLALRMLRSEAEADDLVQDVFLRAWKYRGGMDPAGNVKAWLCRILTNEAARRAGRGRPQVIGQDLSEMEVLPSAARVWQDELPDQEIRRALGEVPPDFAAALVLHAVEGFSYKEIAAIQEVPIGTVMSRLYRARQQMRRVLSSADRGRLKVVK